MPKDPVLDKEILKLSDVDVIRFRDIIEGGCFVSGGLGAGKSSTVLHQLAMSFLYSGFGGLILTVKSDETARWIEKVKAAGREKDLIVFNVQSGLSFDPIAYLSEYGGRAAGLIETIVEAFTLLMNVGKVQQQSSGEQYFLNAVEELIRAVLVVLSHAKQKLSILSMYRLIASLPQSDEQIDSAEWQKGECSRIINELKQRQGSLTISQRDDLDVAIVHLLEKWASLDYRTKSNIESTWSGMASRFVYDPFRSLFCSGRFDFTPEQITHKRKLIIVDIPALEYGRQTSRICQILVKMIFQKAWLRHPYVPGCCNGAFIFQDEFAYMLHKDEGLFHTVCRAAAVAPICACQNILSLAGDEFGEQTPGSKTLGFLGLFALKFWLANNETLTNEWAANQIGREWKDIGGWTAGTSEEHQHHGVSGHKQLVHLVEPTEFTRLLKPDGEQPLAEAICHMSGRSFNITKSPSRPQGLPYLRVRFSR
jgi:hypothetical protein